jgi:hypothetical protein
VVRVSESEWWIGVRVSVECECEWWGWCWSECVVIE